MKLQLNSALLNSLLMKKAPKAAGLGVSPAARAEQSKRVVLGALAKWGHLRSAELSRIVWPEAAYAQQLCQRLVKSMEKRGEVLTRANSVGTRSFVLTRPGAALAEAMGFRARHGLDLASVSGATFIHRMVAANYGIEREIAGGMCYGEHAIAGGDFLISRAEIARRYGKLPDLLVVQKNALDWVEVESAAKSKDEIQRCLLMLRYCDKRIIDSSNIQLDKLIFVCDARLNHESRIKRSAKDLWSNLTPSERKEKASRVWIVHVQLGLASKWLGMSPPKMLTL